MTNEIYEAFVEAGLEKEARQLSTTITDSKGNTKVVPAIGHYITVVDNILDLERQFPDRGPNKDRTAFYSDSVNKILGHAKDFGYSEDYPDKSKLLTKLQSIFFGGRIR